MKINYLQKMKHPLTAQIIANIELAQDIYEISFDCPDIVNQATPGQFISILCENLILRRPFSIAGIHDNTVKIIYKIKGEGTKYISRLKKGEFLNILGPLGNGFNIIEENSLLIGAGVGIAPVLFLSDILERQNIPYKLLAGFKTSMRISGLNQEKSLIVTEDNSSSHRGFITDYIKEQIEQIKPEKIFCCGPEIVLKQIINLAQEYNIETEAALEKVFACGIGVCMGCNIQIKEDNKIINKRICKDGPIFDGRTIVW